MPGPRPTDVIVVGGGVIGASVAFHAARAGLSVRLMERDAIGAHASGAAAGMLAPICEAVAHDAFLELGLRSLDLTPHAAAEVAGLSGIDPQYRPSGVLRVALTTADEAHLRDRQPWLAHYGVEWCDAGAARSREPRLSRQVRGALWSPREGHVYSPHFTQAYALAAAALGASVEVGAEVTGLLRRGARIVGVNTESGPREAGEVVICGGAWAASCAAWADVPMPIRPVRGQIVAFALPVPPPPAIVWSEGVYLVPKADGRLIAGATEEDVGFDCRTTPEGLAALNRAAVAVLPELAKAPVLGAWAGLRPDTPDHLPALGPVPGVQGLVLAGGHFRNGVLLSAVTGDLLAGYLTGAGWPAYAAPFLPDRLLCYGGQPGVEYS